jgi:hypothetical protein
MGREGGRNAGGGEVEGKQGRRGGRIRGREITAYGVINLSVSGKEGRKRLMAGRPAQAANNMADILRPADTPAGQYTGRPIHYGQRILRPVDTLSHASGQHAGTQRKSSGRWSISISRPARGE